MLSTYKYSRYSSNESDEGYVEKGIRIGTMLGKKLQVRGESRDTKWTRQDKGRLDKRLIAELGFGNERVFSTNFVESYSDAILHISVDASGSMGGDKWENTMTSVVAICKAVSMIQNVDVVVSIRSTHNSSGSYRSRKSGEHPVILIAYDSRVDKFSKVKNLFGFIRCSGTTPEGLCYEAIMNEIIPASNNRESYFLNFSDGMPMFSNDDVDYYHDTALNHTKKMVEEIKNRGIKVLSYFIGDEYDRGERNMDAFKTMYGKDSQFIDVTSVMAVSKTMNKKFLEK
jgi:nitric oxide reductase activation protein